MTHLKLANSPLMAVLCGLTILIVLLQPVIFMAAAFKRGKELNMTKEEMKEAARSSAIFSIIPSLPIIVSYLLLVPALGRYFPWLRLSVVGSAVYETMVANMAAEAFGLEPSPQERSRWTYLYSPLCGHHRYPWRKHLQRILLKEL